MTSPVRIVRDRWGIPHIYADSTADVFFAQGFVQAQDRLFQMDLWRRSVQGRLSEVLGANFIERDAMTRRVQYHGEMNAEWDSYGPDARGIADAFVRGVNAWIDIASGDLPEEFRLAGWRPERWRAEDLLNRTDAFVMSGNAADEVFRAQVAAAVGVRQADALTAPAFAVPMEIPRDLDLSSISYVIGDALREVGAPPFFTALMSPVATGSNAWAVAADRSTTGGALLAVDPHRPLNHPSSRYLVHLHAPGWNVIGATAPWLPGVAIGHNDDVAWGMTARPADVQDVFVEKVNPSNPHQVEQDGRWVDTAIIADPIIVKGRAKPFPFERETTSHGVIIASDRARHLAFTIRWTGFEPGTAAELGSLAVDRARSEGDLRAAVNRWRLPAATVVYATRAGRVGLARAGWVPHRNGWNGSLPAPAWTERYRWNGFGPNADRIAPAPRGFVASANDSIARTRRLDTALSTAKRLGIDDFEALQHDTLAWNAERLVPLLEAVRSSRDDVEAARRRLLRWDRRVSAASTDASVYVLWERSLLRRLAAERLKGSLADEFVRRAGAVLVPALTTRGADWFAGNARRRRDAILVDSLTEAMDAVRFRWGDQPRAWGAVHAALFQHPLAVTAAARGRFNIGPFPRAGYADTVMSTGGVDLDQTTGATFRMIADAGNWDRSVATNAPGQSESPASAHFADLAKGWAAGEYFPLWFSNDAVRTHTAATLMLIPGR